MHLISTKWFVLISKANHSVHSNSSLCPTTNGKEAEIERFFEDLQDPLELTPKWCAFRGLECKRMKSRDIWSNRQVWLWSAQWSRAKADRVLPKERTGVSKHSSNNIRDDYTWISPDGQYRKSDWLYSLQRKIEKLYTVIKDKTRNWLWLRSWTPYCEIQTYIEDSRENQWTIQKWPKSNPLGLYSGSDK